MANQPHTETNDSETFFEQKRREVQSASLIDVMSWVFPIISAFATFVGVEKLVGNFWAALAVAGVAFLFVGAFYRSYLKWFPAANGKARFALLGPMIIFAVFAICLTTPFSAATFGGDIALRKDFEKTIAIADENGTARMNALEDEQSLASALEQSSIEFKTLSGQEADGAFTGTAGRGSAAVTFDTVGQQLGNIATMVAKNKTRVNDLKVQYEQAMTDLRNITYSHDSQQVKVTNFAAKLTELNSLFNQMKSASMIPAVQQSSGSLGIVAQLQTADAGTPFAAKQSATIGKAQDLVGSVQRDIDKAVADHKAIAPMPPMKVMDESAAIFVYAGDIAWAWAVALALDFAPMVFLYMLSVFNDIDDTKKKGKRAKKTTPVVSLASDRRA